MDYKRVAKAGKSKKAQQARPTAKGSRQDTYGNADLQQKLWGEGGHSGAGFKEHAPGIEAGTLKEMVSSKVHDKDGIGTKSADGGSGWLASALEDWLGSTADQKADKARATSEKATTKENSKAGAAKEAVGVKAPSAESKIKGDAAPGGFFSDIGSWFESGRRSEDSKAGEVFGKGGAGDSKSALDDEQQTAKSLVLLDKQEKALKG